MNDLVDRLIAERRAEGEAGDTTDLLGRMLTGVDRQSGEGLPDANIRAQCITFLIAGHETTSGLLSFALYYLLKNPAFLERARAEVDEVLGDTASPTFEQVHRLTYVRQVLDESLRLWPTAPGFTRYPFQDTVIGGQLRHPGEHDHHGAHPGAAPRRRPCGDRTRRTSTPSTWPPNGWQRCHRRSTSRSGPGSAPASGGSSRCRRRRWCSGCSSSAST